MTVGQLEDAERRRKKSSTRGQDREKSRERAIGRRRSSRHLDPAIVFAATRGHPIARINNRTLRWITKVGARGDIRYTRQGRATIKNRHSHTARLSYYTSVSGGRGRAAGSFFSPPPIRQFCCGGINRSGSRLRQRSIRDAARGSLVPSKLSSTPRRTRPHREGAFDIVAPSPRRRHRHQRRRRRRRGE